MKRRLEEEDKEEQKRRDIEAIEPEKSIHADGGGWRRGKILGSGAHGKVYLAHFLSPSKLSQRFDGFPSEAAVKSALTPSHSKELEAEKATYQSMAASPHVLHFLGDDVTVAKDGRRFLNVFLEYASGGSLKDFIDEFGKSGLLEWQARGFTRSILLGLSHIHESNVVHRDLKPENVLLLEDGAADGKLVAKIGDFGTARRRINSSGKSWNDCVVGTENYLAPETVIGIQGKESDIWALGCVVYAMLTGKRKWRGQLKDSDVKAERQSGKLSAVAEDFLLKCLTGIHTDRPTAAALLGHSFATGSEVRPQREDDGDERFRPSGDECFASAVEAHLRQAEQDWCDAADEELGESEEKSKNKPSVILGPPRGSVFMKRKIKNIKDE